ncbi:MAG TPA: hypothetical protein VGS01_13925 [Candidatus Limnocylindria bacterium]|nr:hypothetical protein [Candidatus Limnocylindria bacterium]
MSAPRLRIEPLGVAKRDGEGWRTTWRIANPDNESIRVLDAVAPHSKFRGEASLDREVRRSRSMTFPLVVRVEGAAGTDIENAFVILLIQQGALRWRVLARLRVGLEDAGRPRPRIEAVTLQRVGFSGDL